jgi:hypothetical protein
VFPSSSHNLTDAPHLFATVPRGVKSDSMLSQHVYLSTLLSVHKHTARNTIYRNLHVGFQVLMAATNMIHGIPYTG